MNAVEMTKRGVLTAIWCASVLSPGVGCLAAESDVRAIEIFFGTDRGLLGADATGVRYGADRGEVSYGVASFELRKLTQSDESRSGVTKIAASAADPLRAKLLSTRHMRPNKFYATLRDPNRPGRPGELMLMVHGFKRNFETAAENAARLAHAAGFEGRTILWSWPSQNSAAAYLTDRTSLRWSEDHLADFVRGLVQKAGAHRLVLVAHSLGAQGLAFAMLDKIGAEAIRAWPLRANLVLLAPDIDLAIFRRDIAPGLVAANVPTTLYTSASDRAMIASTKVNGYPRVGDSSDRVYTFEGVETVDATRAYGSFLGHSYYRLSSKVADDLHLLIVERQPASLRQGLVRVEVDGATHWEFAAD